MLMASNGSQPSLSEKNEDTRTNNGYSTSETTKNEDI